MVFQTGPILVFASLVEICLQPAWSEPRRARRNGQSCAYEAPGMAHGDVDMPDVHVDSRAVDDEPGPTTARSVLNRCTIRD